VRRKCKDNPDLCFRYFDLKKCATPEEIKEVYKRWSKSVHPDKCKVEEFKKYARNAYSKATIFFVKNQAQKMLQFLDNK
jgi:hypothetical protein